MPSQNTFVALLRGINLGGKNPLSMQDVAGLFADAGASDVRTYIQSGNVVFRAPVRVAERLPTFVSKRIAERFALRVPVLLRSAAQLAEIAHGNPFLRAGGSTDFLHVVFLADEPDPRRVASLDSKRSPPDQFAVIGREIYLRCPNGIGRSKLTNDYFDRTLGTTTTGRNWRTVLKLIELASK